MQSIFLGILALFVVETLVSWRLFGKTSRWNQAGPSPAETLSSFVFASINYGFGLVWFLSFIPVLKWAKAYQVLEMDKTIWYWPTLFVLHEFLFYWHHRFGHTFALPWLFHGVHHTSTRMNLLAGARSLKGGLLTMLWVFVLPLVLLGYSIGDVLLMYSVTMTYQVFMHTELVGSLGFLDRFFMTPVVHRIHHGCNQPYLNKNFGGILCVFDRLFGTHQLLDAQVPLVYGAVDYKADQRNPFSVVWNLWKPYLYSDKALKLTTWFKPLSVADTQRVGDPADSNIRAS